MQIYAKPGTVAGACQPSRWAVTLMDVHSLGKGVKCVAIKTSSLYWPGQRLRVCYQTGGLIWSSNVSNPPLSYHCYLEDVSSIPSGGKNLFSILIHKFVIRVCLVSKFVKYSRFLSLSTIVLSQKLFLF